LSISFIIFLDEIICLFLLVPKKKNCGLNNAEKKNENNF